ncbi:MAG: alkylhydroperoxidase-related (seleno)protein [Gammaproteobacteria bacterium]|nr:alkylhydroperoxidase-related (seleno)protein [Gammaproteobacteria bacterium]
MYETTQYPIRPALKQAHESVWQRIAETGSFWSGEDRVAIVNEARASLSCSLCQNRKNALSPNALSGSHDSVSHLPPIVVDLIHRLRTDPGRFTKTVFEQFCERYPSQEYVEIISVVASSVIIDTMHSCLGLDLPDVGRPDTRAPTGSEPALVEEGGAWLPLGQRDQRRSDLGFRRVPNILRAMGSVPSAVSLFFTCFRSHYSMMGVPLDLHASQCEFIAARVSALNECFY